MRIGRAHRGAGVACFAVSLAVIIFGIRVMPAK